MATRRPPGTIPPPGRVPGRSSDLSRIGVDDGGGSGPVVEKVNTVLGFLFRGDYIVERVRSVEARGHVTTCPRGRGGTCAGAW